MKEGGGNARVELVEVDERVDESARRVGRKEERDGERRVVAL